MPGLRQRVLDAGRSDNKEGRVQPGSHLLKAVARSGQVISAQAVDHHRLPGRRHVADMFRQFGRRLRFEQGQRHVADGQWCLFAQMQAHVGFLHRRDRVHAHDRVAVNAVDLAVSARAREQVAKQAVAAQRRRAGDDGHHWLRECRPR